MPRSSISYEYLMSSICRRYCFWTFNPLSDIANPGYLPIQQRKSSATVVGLFTLGAQSCLLTSKCALSLGVRSLSYDVSDVRVFRRSRHSIFGVTGLQLAKSLLHVQSKARMGR